MNEELQQRLVSIMDFLETGVKSATEFTVEQTPLLVQEIITWHITMGILSIVGFLLISVISFFFFGWLIKKVCDSDNEDESGGYIFLILVNSTLFVSSFVSVVTYCIPALKAWIAPRLFLIEYVSNLIS